jgi:hypothetical protein
MSDESEEKFIMPCDCNGTAKYVHRSCLDLERSSGINQFIFHRCSICRFVYEVEVMTDYWYNFKIGLQFAFRLLLNFLWNLFVHANIVFLLFVFYPCINLYYGNYKDDYTKGPIGEFDASFTNPNESVKLQFFIRYYIDAFVKMGYYIPIVFLCVLLIYAIIDPGLLYYLYQTSKSGFVIMFTSLLISIGIYFTFQTVFLYELLIVGMLTFVFFVYSISIKSWKETVERLHKELYLTKKYIVKDFRFERDLDEDSYQNAQVV